MSDCFEFKEDDTSLTPIWALLSSLPLECWHPNALGNIGSRLGTPITMDSLTMKMERVSYARIFVEVDASKTLVDQVEFILPNGATRKQPVIYEFTPKFCTKFKLFDHLKDSCQGPQPPAVVATTPPVATIKPVATKWTLVQRRQKRDQKHEQNGPHLTVGKTPKSAMGVQQSDIPIVGKDEQGQHGPSRPQPSMVPNQQL
ncbi:UNVERIFIED_CONTAM: hypothetical protein Slati_2255600 [Sesamum latifolium]|uniref:DUF4283 domain-containing protein n=1 Tax=Sesamum latifolium TaxID=2727402 RepID=A0AAW2WUE4_9LAMI